MMIIIIVTQLDEACANFYRWRVFTVCNPPPVVLSEHDRPLCAAQFLVAVTGAVAAAVRSRCRNSNIWQLSFAVPLISTV